MPWNVPQKYYDMHPLDQIELPPTKEDDLSDVPAAGRKMAKASGDHQAVLESGRWKEAVQHDEEHPMLIKTTVERYPALEAAIRAGHPYELPEIIAVPVVLGLPAYLDWVQNETHP